MTLTDLIAEHGEAVVFSWALIGQKEAEKKKAKRRGGVKPPSMAAVNRWLKTATDDEINSLKSLALNFNTSIPISPK